MANFYSFYPPAGSGLPNASVGPNGTPIPSDSTLIGGENADGDLQPLQTDDAGNLLVSINAQPNTPLLTQDAADGTLGAPIPSVAISIGGQDINGDLQSVLVDDSGNLNAAVVNTSIETDGTITGNGTLSITLPDYGTPSVITINVSGGSGGTISLRSSIDGSTFPAIPMVEQITGNVVNTIPGTSGLTYQADITGGVGLRLVGSSVTGTVIVHTRVTTLPSSIVAIRNLPPGASTLAEQALQLTQETAIAVSTASIDTKTPTVGQKAMAASSPVVIASDQASIPVAATLSAETTKVIGTVNVSGGQTIGVTQNTIPWADNISQFGGNSVVTGTGASGVGIPRVTVSSDSSVSLGTGSAVIGHVLVDAGSAIIGKVGIDQTTPGTTNGVQVNAALPAGTNLIGIVAEVSAATATVTSVASANVSTSLLALNTSRKNATFFNDSTQILYLKLGTTASTSSYTVQMAANSYYELPAGKIYTGAIDGIWAAANGNVRITELT